MEGLAVKVLGILGVLGTILLVAFMMLQMIQSGGTLWIVSGIILSVFVGGPLMLESIRSVRR